MVDKTMTRGARLAAAGLLLLTLVVGAANLVATYQEVHSSANAIRAAAARAARQQQEAGRVIEQKLCTTFGGIASLQPPAGNPETNPSRGYEQHLHAKLAQVGPDIRCPSGDRTSGTSGTSGTAGNH